MQIFLVFFFEKNSNPVSQEYINEKRVMAVLKHPYVHRTSCGALYNIRG